jgi:hypothetical protein
MYTIANKPTAACIASPYITIATKKGKRSVKKRNRKENKDLGKDKFLRRNMRYQ